MAVLQIRPMDAADLDGVREIELRSFTDPWSRWMLAAELGRSRTCQLIAAQDEKIAGYIFLQHVLGEGEITNIAVSPDFRRQGIGAKLLRAAVAQAQAWELDCLFLEVRESNLPAIALYGRFGFTVNGRRPGYYQNPREDALLMHLKLR